MLKKPVLVALALATALLTSSQTYAQTTFTDTGADAADIQATVDNFRNALGTLNPFTAENFVGGRRQIDWDAAPDFVSAPNDFPGDFFNFNVSPRARGIEFTTPGTGFQLSATAASGEGIEFDNIDPSYSSLFDTFSAERLFTPIGSTITEVSFFDPADQSTPTVTNGFGAVFTDIDLEGGSFIQVFDANDNLIETLIPGVSGGDQGLSFVGIVFDTPVIASVRIGSGTVPLAPGLTEDIDNTIDLVALDDFIFGEPVGAVPEPTALVLMASMATLGAMFRRR